MKKRGFRQVDLSDPNPFKPLMDGDQGTKEEKLFAVLNARYHEQEAFIVAEAGVPGAITIATNMAGRGTDIQLGGNLKMRVEHECQGLEGEAREAAIAKIKAEIAKNREKVMNSGEVIELEPAKGSKPAKTMQAPGGLYVIAAERHESRRIDNQLRGRSGRQGDPGRSKFFLSLEDDLMRIFGSDGWTTSSRSLACRKAKPSPPLGEQGAGDAQKKVEARNFEIRKNILKYDDVMNDQRKVVFEQRRELMAAPISWRPSRICAIRWWRRSSPATSRGGLSRGMECRRLKEENRTLPRARSFGRMNGRAKKASRRGNPRALTQAADEAYAAREQKNTPDLMRYIERQVVLQTLDHLWREHLVTLDHCGRSLAGAAMRSATR